MLTLGVSFPAYSRAWLDGVIPTAVANVSEQCKMDSVIYRDSLAAMEDWALRMFDATGKMPDGILNGNWHALGDYEECLRINPANLDFRGKYCQVFFDIAAPKPTPRLFPIWFFQLIASGGVPLDPADTSVYRIELPSFGLCIPSSCSAADVSTAITAMTTGNETILGIGLGFTGTTSEGYCAVGDTPIELNADAMAMISVLSALGIQILIGTLADLSFRLGLFKKRSNIGSRYFDCFSLVANGERLLSVKPSADNLGCIHGLRFFSFTWVLIGHVYSLVRFPTRNMGLLANQALTSVAFQVITNAYVSVDSFFFMSGLLLAYLYLKAMKKTGKKWGVTCQVNPGMLILHRYLRLTPAYALILGFYATIWPNLNHGPAWDLINYICYLCRENWWTNLLYVNNVVEGHGGCMGVTWYLAVEFQIFIVAVFFVWLMYINEFIGVIATVVATLAGCIAAAVAMVEWDMPPVELIFASEQFSGYRRYGLEYYGKPWFRFPPFFVGMLAGWIIYKIRQPTFVKPSWLTPFVAQVLAIVGWIVAAVSASAVLYGMSEYVDSDPLVPPEVQAIYGGFHRTVWAICLGWLVLACVFGYGGPINAFLSWSPFVVLGRLTFCAYLIHSDWILFYNAYARTPLYYTNMTMAYTILGHLVSTLILATIANLAFEGPFLGLEKLIFGSSEKKVDVQNSEDKASKSHAESMSNGSEADSSEGAADSGSESKEGIVSPDFGTNEEL